MTDKVLDIKSEQPIMAIKNKEDMLLFNAVLTSLVKDCVNDPEGTWLKWVNSKDEAQLANAAFVMTRPLIQAFVEAQKLIKDQNVPQVKDK